MECISVVLGRCGMMIEDIETAHTEANREYVARECVPCVNCGQPIFWLRVRKSYGHVHGDRIRVSGRCSPGLLAVAEAPFTLQLQDGGRR